jgi:hypothetical protein
MMILSGTKTLTASLAAAPATTQPTFVVAYAEVNATQVTEDTNEVTATGTTPVTVLSFPAAGFRRVIKSLFVTNLDTVPTTVTVFINGFPAGKATIGSGLSVDLASSTAIPVSQGQVATGTLMGNNSGVSNLPFALSATASLTLLGIPGLQTSGITGNLTLSKTGVTARTQTARDASGNLCLDSVNNGFTVSQSIDRGTGALPAPVNSTNILATFANANAASCNLEFFSFATSGFSLRPRIAGGTRAAPTAVADGQIFTNITNGGYDGSAWQADSLFYRSVADGIWSGANRGAYHTWTGTSNGSTAPAEWMRLQNGCQTLGGIAAVSGNGLVQLASGTTKANGIAFGDVNIFRNAAGSAKVGGNNAFASFTVDGNAAGSSGGAYIGIMNNGGSNTFLGNYSAIHGGAHDPIATIWGSAGIYIGAGALTKNIFIDSTVGGLTSSAPTGGVGYSTGAGGTVTQITSRTTGVTLNKITGAITLVSAAGSVAWQSFTVTNSAVAATDTIICNQVSGTDLNMIHVTAIAAGSFRISFATTAGVTVEQPVFRFTVIKSVSA